MKDDKGIEYYLDDFCKEVSNKKIVIFGAGKYGKYIYSYLADKNISIYSISDNNLSALEKIGRELRIGTITFEELKREFQNYYVIIAVGLASAKMEVKKQLVEAGLAEKNLVIPIPPRKTEFFDEQLIDYSEFVIGTIGAQWKYRQTKGSRIVDYLESNELFNIGIYETECFKGWIDAEIIDSKIKIVFKTTTSEVLCQSEKCNAIIVLDEINYQSIEEKLMDVFECPIISIWDIVK